MTFQRRLQIGHAVQADVAAALRDLGVAVDETPPTMRPSYAVAHLWSNERDLTANGQRIEVKAVRCFSFGPDPAAFPRDSMIMDNASAWDAKDPKPYAYVFVCVPTRAMLACRGDRDPHPHRRHGYDSLVGKEREWCMVLRRELRSVRALAGSLRSLRPAGWSQLRLL